MCTTTVCKLEQMMQDVNSITKPTIIKFASNNDKKTKAYYTALQDQIY